MNPAIFFSIPALLVLIAFVIWNTVDKSSLVGEIFAFVVAVFSFIWFLPIGACSNWGGIRVEELKNITVSKGTETVFIEAAGEVFTFKDAKTYTNIESITALKITKGYNIYGCELPQLKRVEAVFTINK